MKGLHAIQMAGGRLSGLKGLSECDGSGQALIGHTATSVGSGQIVIFGGAVLDEAKEIAALTSAAHLLDLATGTWTPLQAVGAIPGPRVAHAAACVAPGKLVMHGGSMPAAGEGHGHIYGELYSLELEGPQARWQAVSTSQPGPPPRYGHAMAFCHPHLVVFGGSGVHGALADLWVLNLKSLPLTWCEVPVQSCWPQARMYHSVGTCNEGSGQGMMLMFGGRSSSRKALGDTWALRRLGDRWEWRELPAAKSERPAARCMHSCVALGSLFLVVGGCADSDVAGKALPTAIFDVDAGTWHSLPECPRLRHACCAEGSTVCMIGGLDNSGSCRHTSMLQQLSLVTPAWMEERGPRSIFNVSPDTCSCTAVPANAQQAPPLRIMELFAGTGDFSATAEALSMRTVAVSEVNPECVEVFASKFPHANIFGDLSGMSIEALRNLLPNFDVLTGSFLCPLSIGAGTLRGALDKRADVFNIISLVLRAKQPLALLLENPAELRSNSTQGGRPEDALREVLEEVRKAGYTTAVQVTNCNGTLERSQRHDRSYIVGFRSDLGVKLQDGAIVDPPKLQRTVREILDLAPSERELPDKVVRWLSSPKSVSSDGCKRCIGPADQAVCCMELSSWRKLLWPRGGQPAEQGRRRSRSQGFPDPTPRSTGKESPCKEAGLEVSPPVVALLLGAVAELLRDLQSCALAPSSSHGRWAAWRLLGASLEPGRELPQAEAPSIATARLPRLLDRAALEGKKRP